MVLSEIKDKISHIQDEIIDQYLYDSDSSRPWIIGFSGGKDSTILLQLVWYALLKVPKELRTREVFVVCNDTMVENPKIVEFIEETLKKIESAAVKQGMPVTVHQTRPILEESFWVNLIGRGYPAPNNLFRWCTERLKIKPTTKLIIDKINQNGEVIILLGTRSDESSNRAASLKRHEISGSRLRKHSLPNAFVYTPISHLTTDEVWQYLATVKPPWGKNHHRLITLYKNASDGDCPLVIDTSTPSCGNSRFGCWVCTVVSKDKSMGALIDNGEEWMLPLADLRDFLSDSRSDKHKRETRRRNGQDGVGPYTEDARYEILKMLLEAQAEVRKYDPSLQLISNQELVAIQVMWHREAKFKYNVSDLYHDIFSYKLPMKRIEDNQKLEDNLLKDACKDDQQFKLIKRLLQLQEEKSLMRRKHGLMDDFQKSFDDYFKNEFESVKES